MNSFFQLHIKKAAGQSMRKSLQGYYSQVNRFKPMPFVAQGKNYWNDILNNFRIPLDDFDYKRMLQEKNIFIQAMNLKRCLNL